ncbi:MAG: hypothetical protein IKP81_00370 [Paludibacteraceae bacterium]|nr:hypothetical protein [Paludibacteraceae bacterium]
MGLTVGGAHGYRGIALQADWAGIKVLATGVRTAVWLLTRAVFRGRHYYWVGS